MPWKNWSGTGRVQPYLCWHFFPLANWGKHLPPCGNNNRQKVFMSSHKKTNYQLPAKINKLLNKLDCSYFVWIKRLQDATENNRDFSRYFSVRIRNELGEPLLDCRKLVGNREEPTRKLRSQLGSHKVQRVFWLNLSSVGFLIWSTSSSSVSYVLCPNPILWFDPSHVTCQILHFD